ncbi:MAG: SDR family oxidoreductase [Hyphomicrobiales bacterium]|nr:SDR family oxidoreductase [Hyphomicrobiales bacterium]
MAGQVVMITGAAGGIGTALVEQFGARGAAIAALDIKDTVNAVTRKLARDGIGAVAAVADIANAEQVARAVGEFRSALGPISILINNAGFSQSATVERTTPAIWQHDIDGNLNGAFNCAHAVLPDMKAAGGGSIVNISSVNGLAALGDPAYSAAKAGMISLTRSLAQEYGRFGIRTNAVCPGTVRTPIWDERKARNPAVLEELESWYPLGRIAEPSDIAKAALFLASDDAAAITGVALPVDCGLSTGNLVMTRSLIQEEI